jgi:hypothetical protein
MEPAMPLFNNGMLREGLTFILTAIEKEKTFYAKAVRLEGQNSFPEMMISCAKEIVLAHMDPETVKKKLVYDWVTMDRLAEYYAQAASLMLINWIRGGMKEPINEVVDVYLTLIQEPMLDVLQKT